MMIKYYFNTFALKYGLHHPPSISASPLVLLGKAYISSEVQKGIEAYDEPSSGQSRPLNFDHYRAFIDDYQSRFWFTYRTGITPSLSFPFETDAGWGCMIRSGQMMLAQAMTVLILGRDWVLGSAIDEEIYHDKILSQFMDVHHKSAIFSIFQIVKAGSSLGIPAGTWFTPTLVGEALSKIISHTKSHDLQFLICREGSIYRDQVAHCASSPWKPIIIYVPLRLGVDKINPIYIPQLLQVFKWKQSLGFVGGKPRCAYYFVGSQDEYLFFLDPHVLHDCQGPLGHVRKTYHCTTPSKMTVHKLDSCLALGFLCKTSDDFEDLCTRFKNMSDSPSLNMVHVYDQTPAYLEAGHSSNADSEHYTDGPQDDAEDFAIV
eukprot:TRINITY_DN7545_c0_g1_i3.p1 TRINITY_DN7545_c0_g1~~TRINITY_DN7545_c0_g1_i3.p1  ORF type:complete len:375 (+),score=59.91 TRINITY_DN7545_c0_g1_i3:135-1259(+)